MYFLVVTQHNENTRVYNFAFIFVKPYLQKVCWKRKIEGDIGIHDIEDSQHKANKSKKYHSIITEEHLK